MKKPSIPKLLEKAQKIFNRFIRNRDSEDGYFTCISCGKTLPVESMNAGHYVPQKGGSLLRFNEMNVHGQCQFCNCFDSFHLIGYRKRLIDKIGVENVDWLEASRHEVYRWSRSELMELIEKYSTVKQ